MSPWARDVKLLRGHYFSMGTPQVKSTSFLTTNSGLFLFTLSTLSTMAGAAEGDGKSHFPWCSAVPIPDWGQYGDTLEWSPRSQSCPCSRRHGGKGKGKRGRNDWYSHVYGTLQLHGETTSPQIIVFSCKKNTYCPMRAKGREVSRNGWFPVCRDPGYQGW